MKRPTIQLYKLMVESHELEECFAESDGLQARIRKNLEEVGYGGEWNQTTLGKLLAFSNGRSSPERNEVGSYPVFGSNGLIGYAEET